MSVWGICLRTRILPRLRCDFVDEPSWGTVDLDRISLDLQMFWQRMFTLRTSLPLGLYRLNRAAHGQGQDQDQDRSAAKERKIPRSGRHAPG